LQVERDLRATMEVGLSMSSR